MKRVLLVLVIAGLALVAPAAGKVGNGPTTFTDPTGDARGGVDISAVTVGDASNGALGVSFSATGLNSNADVTFAFDTDRNLTTGHWGDDYLIEFFPDGSHWTFLVSRWSNGDFEPFDIGDATPPGGIGLTAAAEIPRADLGGSNGFDFYVVARNYDALDNVTGRDDAPDTTRWDYSPVQLAGSQLLRPVVSAPLAPVPVAGKSWTVAYAITRSDNGQPFAVPPDGGAQAFATVGDRLIAPTGATYRGGVLRITFKLLPGDRGQVLRIPLAVYSGTQLGWQDSSFTVR